MAFEPSTRLPFRYDDLNPNMVGPVAELAAAARDKLHWSEGNLHYRMEPFEGLRLGSRQYHLLTVDRTTKAGPWQSAHQYGLAVDFAGYRIDMKLKPHWSWNAGNAIWLEFKDLAARFGLDVPIEWDRGHVVHPLWNRYRSAMPT